MPDGRISRRRALTIIAAAGASPAQAAEPAREESFVWRGTALGADARLVFLGTTRAGALAMTRRCLSEVERLENIFSLYRASSELAELNRRGKLDAASQDMRRLLRTSHRISRLTRGMFDPTVHRLLTVYGDWFAARPGTAGPPPRALEEVRLLVDYRRIRMRGAGIEMGRGQSLTLNGIAQGYITDRVARLMARHGWTAALINLGEYRALGCKREGSGFQIALGADGPRVGLANAALATSAGRGFVFPSRSRRYTHLIDPRTGQSPRLWAGVHVRHPSATMADGLSTAFSAMSVAEIRATLKDSPQTSVWALAPNGRIHHMEGPSREKARNRLSARQSTCYDSSDVPAE